MNSFICNMCASKFPFYWAVNVLVVIIILFVFLFVLCSKNINTKAWYGNSEKTENRNFPTKPEITSLFLISLSLSLSLSLRHRHPHKCNTHVQVHNLIHNFDLVLCMIFAMGQWCFKLLIATLMPCGTGWIWLVKIVLVLLNSRPKCLSSLAKSCRIYFKY